MVCRHRSGIGEAAAIAQLEAESAQLKSFLCSHPILLSHCGEGGAQRIICREGQTLAIDTADMLAGDSAHRRRAPFPEFGLAGGDIWQRDRQAFICPTRGGLISKGRAHLGIVVGGITSGGLLINEFTVGLRNDVA